MKMYSHLLTAFLESAWFLEQQTYDKISDLLEAHALGRKEEFRSLPKAFFGTDKEDQEKKPDEEEKDNLQNGIAVINVRGVLAKHADEINGECQPQGRSYESLIAQLEAANSNPEIHTVLLRLETPGGSANGAQEVYDALRALNKPVHAYVDGYCYSAGYYLASACESITASSVSAGAGSIGCIMATWDTSAADEKAGYKRVVIRSGPHKALGVQGEAITDSVRAELQRDCNAYAAAFRDAVQAGRGFTNEQTDAVATGRCFLGNEAKTLGLIDGIQSWSAFVAQFTPKTGSPPNAPTKESPMLFGKTKTPPTKTEADNAAPAPKGLSKDDFAALAGEFPNAIDRLKALDAEGKPAEEILATLLRETVKAQGEQLAAAQKIATDNAKAHAEALSAKDATIAELQGKMAKVQSWSGTLGATEDPGSNGNADTKRSSDTIKAAWDADKSLQQNFALGGILSYVEHLRLTGAITTGEAQTISAELKPKK